MRRAVAAATLALAAASPAGARAGAALASVPYRTYAPPEVVVVVGQSLMLVQLDPVERHDVVSADLGEDGRPLFANSRTLSFGEVEVVAGVEQLPPGRWPFICSIHAGMLGEVIVV